MRVAGWGELLVLSEQKWHVHTIVRFFFFFKVIGTMSCLGMWVPRATMFTDMTSAW